MFDFPDIVSRIEKPVINANISISTSILPASQLLQSENMSHDSHVIERSCSPFIGFNQKTESCDCNVGLISCKKTIERTKRGRKYVVS